MCSHPRINFFTLFFPFSVTMKFLSATVSFAFLLHLVDGFFTPSLMSSSVSRLFMQPNVKERVSAPIDLAAFSDSSFCDVGSTSSRSRDAISMPTGNVLEEFVVPVLSTALLITGNTVGASMLVLPDLAAGPGMAISSSVLVGAYFMNLMSGLCIAQVAIQQHDSSGDEVPSSFKEFAQANLFQSAASIVSGISIFVNSLVLAFDTTKAGEVLGSITGISTSMVFPWAVIMLAIVSTQSLARLSQVASVLVVGLFASFAGLLLPGLANVHDPIAVLASAPSNMEPDQISAVLHMAPVFVTTLVYQNIVPTVTRILGYDRTKVVSAITLGSFIPLCIYLAWCVAVLGGGISTSMSGIGGGIDLFTVFSLVTVAGSSIGALMSLAGEFEILLGQQKKDTFSFPSVALPSVVALGVCHLFADDISGALKVAGSFGSPLLYGIIPVAMAYMQKQRQSPSPLPERWAWSESVMPGGMAGLGFLGLGATGLVGSELVATVGQVGAL